MPIVEIKLWKGRSYEQKAEMARKITDVISIVGKTAPENVKIIFNDVEKSNWAEGGELAE